jgi:N-acetylmuramoyl-L-alanine amidase
MNLRANITTCFLITLIVLSVTLGVASRSANAVPGDDDPRYLEIRSKLFTLRNRDPELTQQAAWREITQLMINFSESHRRSPSAPRALYDAAVALELLEKRGEELSHASTLYERILKEYAHHELADDALIKLARRALVSDRAQAEILLRRVATDYPKGDQQYVATLLLEQLNRGAESLESSPTPLEEDHRSITVVLDPGHGGEDYGAVGVGAIYEKDVTLDIAYHTKSLLEESQDVRVVLTRTADSFVPLASRTAKANSEKAAVFVSIHTNASIKGTSSGMEIYTLDTTNDKAAKLLAERENKSQDQHAPSDLDFILSDLIQDGKSGDSRLLAQFADSELSSLLKRQYPSFKRLGVKKAPFFVLVGAHMPCILIETLFLDHAQDSLFLSQQNNRKLIAQGIRNGIDAYLNSRVRARDLKVPSSEGAIQ